MLDGVLIIDKPVGPTSHDVVAQVRRALHEQRVGHTGTLDPGASGVLPLVIGRATRLARFLSGSDKTYDATIRLGQRTDTCDAQGKPVGASYDGPWPGAEAIEAALESFRGAFLQQPPIYSAKKVDGQRSYRLARAAARGAQHPARGTPAPRTPLPVPVNVTALTLVTVADDRVTLSVTCSAGFYVRSLASDLGDRLDTGAHLLALRRTRSGDYGLSDCVALDTLLDGGRTGAAGLIPLARLLPHLRWVVLTREGVVHARHGRNLVPAVIASRGDGSAGHAGGKEADGRWCRLFDEGGDLLGLAHTDDDSTLLHPSVILM